MKRPELNTTGSINTKGWAGLIDISAWVSGGAFLFGLLLAGLPTVEATLLSGNGALMVVGGAFAVFFASIMLVQRHMRLSLLANTYGRPKHLVTSGVFEYSRNPIYVAFLVPLASISVFSLAAAIAAIAVYMWLMTSVVIRREEDVLMASFGAEFAAYLERVPRWFALPAPASFRHA